MKKIILFLLLAASVFAVSIDEECQENGFSTGIAKFESIGSAAEGPVYPYDINVTGDLQEADWESNMEISGVIVKAGQNVKVFDGGYDGTVSCLNETKKDKTICQDISHITFCKNGGSSNGGDGPHGVPEFSTLTLSAVVFLGTLGVVILRKN